MRAGRRVPWCILAAGCAGPAGSMPRAVIDDFIGRSAGVTCEAVTPPAGAVSPEHLADATASTFLVVPANETRVVTLDARLAPVDEVRFERDGPAGIQEVRAVARTSDGLVWIADQRARVVRAFDAGGVRRTVETRFFPAALAAGPQGLFAAAATGGERNAALVHELRHTAFAALPVPPLRTSDFLLSMLANQVSLAARPGGGVIAAHMLLEPVAHIWTPRDGTRTVALPYPDAARALLGYRPQMPFDDDDIAKTPAGALGLTADHGAGELLVLTRSGRRRDGGAERAVIRVDADLRYVRSYLLDVHAVHIAYLSGTGASIVVDDRDRWFRCPTP
jgi:hypothetical protein